MDLSPVALAEMEATTLFVLDAEGRLVATNDIGSPPAPWAFVNRSTAGSVAFVRAGAPTGLEPAVRAFAAGLSPFDPNAGGGNAADLLAEVAAAFVSVQRTSCGPAFVSPETGIPAIGAMPLYPAHAALLHPDLAPWGAELSERGPCFAVMREGRAIAICASARSTPEAAEAGVETATAFRGQGAAVLAVSAWAAAIRESGRVAFYSTSWANEASRAVARKLDLEPFAENISVA
jgi:hypothetical protein